MIFSRKFSCCPKYHGRHKTKNCWVIFYVFPQSAGGWNVGLLSRNISTTEEGGGVEEGQTAISASNAQSRLPCHCNPHILTSLTLAWWSHKELFQISHNMVPPWVGGMGGRGTQLRGSDIVIHLHNFNKRFCSAVVKFKKVQNHF